MKSDPKFKQRGRRVGSSGGFFNQLMSNNSSVPIVGKGATMIYHSDRHAYEVLEVDEKKKMAVIRKYNPKRIDNLGMSDSQDYEYKDFEGPEIPIFYKWGSWKTKTRVVVFTNEAREKYGEFGRKLHDAYKDAGGQYNHNMYIDSVVSGLTKETVQWYTVNIIFGIKQEHFDFSF